MHTCGYPIHLGCHQNQPNNLALTISSPYSKIHDIRYTLGLAIIQNSLTPKTFISSNWLPPSIYLFDHSQATCCINTLNLAITIPTFPYSNSFLKESYGSLFSNSRSSRPSETFLPNLIFHLDFHLHLAHPYPSILAHPYPLSSLL